MSYAIIGSGKVGQALAKAFAREKIEVAIASRRSPEALAPIAKSIGPTIIPKSLQDALKALPHLLKTKGSIVNLSSVSGLGGDWGMSSYNAAKGAVTNFTRALALEYGSRGVRVNAVAPSLTSTDATAELEKSEAVLAAFRERLPIGRAATPDDIARVILFLASEDALFVNGAILPVDGGVTASNGQPNFLSLLA